MSEGFVWFSRFCGAFGTSRAGVAAQRRILRCLGGEGSLLFGGEDASEMTRADPS